MTLYWVAQAGEHDYTVKLYRLVNGQELWEDEEPGSVSVMDSKTRLVVDKLTCKPKEVRLSEWEIDDKVECRVVLWNTERVFIERNSRITVVYDGYILWRYVQWLGTVTIEFILTITELPVTSEGIASTAGKKLLDLLKGYLGVFGHE